MFSSKLLTIIALLAVVFFAALITLQALELMYYDAAPSLWPATP